VNHRAGRPLKTGRGRSILSAYRGAILLAENRRAKVAETAKRQFMVAKKRGRGKPSGGEKCKGNEERRGSWGGVFVLAKTLQEGRHTLIGRRIEGKKKG